MSLPALTTSTPTIPLRFAVGGELGVVGRTEAPVGHLHHAGIGIGGRGSGFFGLATAAHLGSFQFGQALQRFFHPLFNLALGTFTHRLRASACLPRIFVDLLFERLHPLARLLQTFVERAAAAEGCRSGAGAHPHAVLRDPFELDRSSAHQRRYAGAEQLVKCARVLGAKVAQAVVVDLQPAADPAVRIV